MAEGKAANWADSSMSRRVPKIRQGRHLAIMCKSWLLLPLGLGGLQGRREVEYCGYPEHAEGLQRVEIIIVRLGPKSNARVGGKASGR